MKRILLLLSIFVSQLSIGQGMFGSLATDDYNAVKFMTTYSITSTAHKDACNVFTKDMKADGFWTNDKAYYPLLGGTSGSVIGNLRNPGTNDLTLVNSPSISSNGVDWNGSSQYANTGISPSSLSQNDVHISYWSREDVTTAAETDMGAFDAGASSLHMLIKYTGIGFGARVISTTRADVANSNSTGFYLATRTSSTTVATYKNGSSVATLSQASTTATSISMYIGAVNVQGVGASDFSTKQCAFASVGSGRTATQALIYYNDVNRFITKTGR